MNMISIPLTFKDMKNGSITFVVYNYVAAAVKNAQLPVYQYVDEDTSILLGYTNPFNVSGAYVPPSINP